MLRALIRGFKKSRKLLRISEKLGYAATLSQEELMEFIVKEDEGEEERAMEELFELCEADPTIPEVLDYYNADRKTLQIAYNKLIKAGAGQWAKGHYVPVASLVFPTILQYLLNNLDRDEESFRKVAWRLLMYFKNRESEPIRD